ncbi:MAG: calcium-binding protein [Nocardioidaceae bacterium]
MIGSRKPRRPLRVVAAVGLCTGWLLAAPASATATGAVKAPVRCDGHVATIVGTTGRDQLVGTPGDDVITGLAGWDQIDGRGGNDRICGAGGSDSLRGGPGNDRVLGGPDGRIPDEPPLPVGDQLIGGPGNDYVDGGADKGDDVASFSTAAGGVSADLGTGTATGQGRDRLVGIESLVGSPFDDTLRAGGRSAQLSGRAGNDLLDGATGPPGLGVSGGPGQDRILVGTGGGGSGGPGNDRLRAVAGSATLSGDEGADVLLGGVGNDYLVGDSRPSDHWADIVKGGGGNDQLQGGGGANVLEGGGGNDYLLDGPDAETTLNAGSGNDLVQPARGNDETINGGAGTDTISYLQVGSTAHGVAVDLAAGTATGVAGNDTLVSFENVTGSYGPDRLVGDNGPNVLDGDVGNDVVLGGGGNDVVKDSYGADRVDAGSGNDLIRLDAEFTGMSNDTYGGGTGVDTLDVSRTYPEPQNGLVVDLAAGMLTGLGHDSLSGIENVVGSRYDSDVLRGDAGPNVLTGLGGNDRLFGRNGDDTLSGGGGNDLADGGNGIDGCTAEMTNACES